MKNLLTVIGILLLYSCTPTKISKEPSHSSDFNASIDNHVTETLTQFGIPGAAVAVVKNGQVTHQKNYGFANLEHQVPVSDQSIFRIYSLTKLMVSIGVFQLIEQDKLSLEDKISMYVEGIPESWKALQIKHLLTHSSGLPDMAPIPEFRDLSEEAAKAKVFAKSLKFSPGEKFDYNQTNFWLLQRATEKITGIPFDQYILKNQFTEKSETAFFSSDSRDIIANRATAYFPFEKGEMTIEHPYMQGDYAYAMNGFNISLDAFIEWDNKLRNDQLLKPETKAAMLQTFPYSNADMNFTYGWDKRVLNGHDSYGFSGSMVTAYRIFPEDDLSVFFLGNGMSNWFDIEKVINRIANIVDEDIFNINDNVFDQLLATTQSDGYPALVAKYQELKAQYENQNIPFEDFFNSIGYYFLNGDNSDLALKIFELNTVEFPNSWNPYDSLAEAYEKIGDTEKAIKFYDKALSFLNENDNSNKDRILSKIASLR